MEDFRVQLTLGIFILIVAFFVLRWIIEFPVVQVFVISFITFIFTVLITWVCSLRDVSMLNGSLVAITYFSILGFLIFRYKNRILTLGLLLNLSYIVVFLCYATFKVGR
jgi:hypothetical protein